MDNASGVTNQPDWVRTIARLVYPLALAGAAVAAVLNAISWLPIDVAGLTTICALLFAGAFPVFFAAILVIGHQQRLRRERMGPVPWWRSGRQFSWRDVLTGAPRWAVILFVIVVAYVYINFFAGVALLPGQPETTDGQYHFNNHGSQIATDLAGYLQGLRVQMRLLTGHPMVFYGVAALATFGRRARRERASPTR